MFEKFNLVHIERKTKSHNSLDSFEMNNLERILRFHESVDGYRPTPLHHLVGLASACRLKDIWVKDESYRFELNAFKVLGCSYAIAMHIAKHLGENPENMSFGRIMSADIRERLEDITFVTATDGNHGRGVAWIANKLGYKAVVYLPKGASQERYQNIRSLGADVIITEFNYDDTVNYANEKAKEHNWIMVQDTAWEGYEDVPIWIMQGYATMALEAHNQLNGEKPTHIFLQAGVGSMAASVIGFFSSFYKEERPVITVVEPNKSDCFYRTAEVGDGNIHIVTGDMDTIMAGLACGKPNPIAWRIIKNWTDNYISCPDYVAAKGMRVLSSATCSDSKVISGESGAVTAGLVTELMHNSKLKWMREKLFLNKNSRVLLFSTEGDTDKDLYRDIVWNGKYPSFDK